MNTSNIDPVIEDIYGRFKTAGIEVDRNKIRSNLDRLVGYTPFVIGYQFFLLRSHTMMPITAINAIGALNPGVFGAGIVTTAEAV